MAGRRHGRRTCPDCAHGNPHLALLVGVLCAGWTPAAWAQGVTVTGTIEATFPDGIVSCLASTELALKDSLAMALSTVTGFQFESSAVTSVAVDTCTGRRLEEEGGDADARRLTPVATVVTYVASVASASLAAFVASAVASSVAAFAAAFAAQMAFVGVGLSGVVTGAVTSSASLALFSSIDRSVLGTYAADAVEAVSSARWRLVGRSVPQEWFVSAVRFYEDAACTREIPVIPQRNDRGLKRHNGRAFGGPQKRGRGRDWHAAADALEGTGAGWRSTAPCGDHSDTCHIGFDWFGEQVGLGLAGPASGYSATGLLRRAAVSPYCVHLVQSEVAGQYAPTVAVQYKATAASGWRTQLLRADLVGGSVQLRLPAPR